MTSLIFVVGVGRSGTSLLQTMLASHPNIVFLPETSFLRRYLSDGVLNSIFVRGGVNDVVKYLSDDHFFSRLDLDVNDIVQQAASSNAFFDCALYKKILDVYGDDDISWLGDKDPRLIEYIALLYYLFPESVVVNIIRDPRDVLLSKKNAKWSREGHVWKHIFANRTQLKLGRSAGPHYFGDKYVEIIYEELIGSPNTVLENLCKKIDLRFDQSMLNFGGTAAQLVSNEEFSWKKETFGPLLNNNKNKWRNALPDSEVALTEICCKEAFQVGGYITEGLFESLSFKDKVWVILGMTAIFSVDLIYQIYQRFRVSRACKNVK